MASGDGDDDVYLVADGKADHIDCGAGDDTIHEAELEDTGTIDNCESVVD